MANTPIPSTRDRILNAAQDLIQRRGVNAMSFQDLSDAVGIRKASVHHHFATKDDMVSALLERYLAGFDGAIDALNAARLAPRTKLKRYCELFLSTLQENGHEKGCLCGMLAAEVVTLDAKSQLLVRSFWRKNLGFLKSVITAGVGDGSFELDSSVEQTAEFILSTLEGGLLLARSDGGPDQLARITATLLRALAAK